MAPLISCRAGSIGPQLHPRQRWIQPCRLRLQERRICLPTAPPAAGRTGSARPSFVSGSTGSACRWLHQLSARPSHACVRVGDDAHAIRVERVRLAS
jgi:hypothetical protein